MHHMQQEFQVLTAKIGGLEGKKSNMKPPGEQRLINSLISHKVQMKWLNLELCKKKKGKVNRKWVRCHTAGWYKFISKFCQD